MRKHLVALGGIVPALFLSASAYAAPTLVFSENWEDQNAANARWQQSTSCNFLVGNNTAPTAVADTLACSGKIHKDTDGASGGRTWTKKNAPIPIQVAATEKYCVTGWMRAAAGAQGYIGIHMSDVNGNIDQVAGQPPFANYERWLIGATNFPTGFGAGNVVTPTTNDGVWRRYKKEFTIRAGAAPGGELHGAYTYMLLKTVNNTSAENGVCGGPNG